ncbi:MAG: hypothetical protein JST59_29255 [Actinobacteria bacterium]|nr:hypothetical protein [Actinomycetota bacterium]
MAESSAPNLGGGPTATLGIRAALRSPRLRLATLLAVLALAGIVVCHHIEPSGMDDGMAAGMVCLAILGVGTALLAADSIPRWVPRPELPPLRAPRRETPSFDVSWIAARAGPSYLRLSVLRR